MNKKIILKEEGSRDRLPVKSYLALGIIFSIFLTLSFSFVSSLPDDAKNSINFNYPTTINYSKVNVNNSQFLQGLTPQQVANLYVEQDLKAYNGSLLLTGIFNSNPFNWLNITTSTFWNFTGDQSNLSGNKSGSFNIDTTGYITGNIGTFTGLKYPTAILSGGSYISFGDTANALNTNAIALGYGAISSGINSNSFGTSAEALGTGSLALGGYASAKGNIAIAEGYTASAWGSSGVSIGENAVSVGSGDVCIGQNSYTDGATGSYVPDEGRSNTAVGNGISLLGTQNTGVGSQNIGYGNAVNLFGSGLQWGVFGDAVSGGMVGMNMINPTVNPDPNAIEFWVGARSGGGTQTPQFILKEDASLNPMVDFGGETILNASFWNIQNNGNATFTNLDAGNVCYSNGVNCSSDQNQNETMYNLTVTNIATIKTLNVTGNTTLDGNVVILGNFTGNNFYSGVITQSFTGVSGMLLNSTFQVTNFTTLKDNNGFNLINSNQFLQLTNPTAGGEYSVSWRVDEDGTANHNYQGLIYVNEVAQNHTWDRGISTANGDFHLDGFGHIRVNYLDNVSLRISDQTGTSTPTVYLKDLTIERIAN